MKILHDEKILKMLNRAKLGDNEEVENLIKYYTPSIKAKCKKYNITGFDFDDIFNEGIRTLLKCIKSYKFGTTPFSVYFFRALKNELNYILRKRYNEVDISTRIYSSKERVDEEENIEDKLLNKEAKKEIREYISSLTASERKVINEVYFNEKTMAEVSREMKYPFSRIQHIRNVALRKMKIMIK